MEFLVIGMNDSRYSQSSTLVRVWDPIVMRFCSWLPVGTSQHTTNRYLRPQGPTYVAGVAGFGLPT